MVVVISPLSRVLGGWHRLLVMHLIQDVLGVQFKDLESLC